MTDVTIKDRIVAHRSAPDVYDPPTFDQMADRIEELQAQNKRLETEAQLQAEEIDKTRRRADKWQSTVLDCDEYLKPGETPAERIQREINDCLALMKLLEKKQKRIEELEAKLAAAEAMFNREIRRVQKIQLDFPPPHKVGLCHVEEEYQLMLQELKTGKEP